VPPIPVDSHAPGTGSVIANALSGASIATTALTRLHRDLRRNVPHHLGQLAGTDFVEETV